MFRRLGVRAAAGSALIVFTTIAVAVGLHAQSSTSKVITGAEIAKVLPPPEPSKAGTRFSKVIGWPEGLTPKAAPGFAVAPYATGLAQPRWLRVLPNGDVLVAESEGKLTASPNRITLLRDTKKAGKADQRSVLIANVRQPFGMLLKGDVLYVAGSDALWTYPFKVGDTSITSPGKKILDLPTGQYNYHWTRDVVASADGSKLFVSIGSGTNVDEEHDDRNEPRRATVIEVNPDGSGMRIFASGLRNPVGLAVNPESKALWAVINERDMLGDELVPDYMTSVKDGAFYGWPYSYYGQIEDPRKKGERPDLVAKAIPPDMPLGAHVAPLGIAFYGGSGLPDRYKNGAFVSEHGSWNRTRFNGYKVVFVPFSAGMPSGAPEDVLTGFIKDEATNEVYGRPVGIAELADGSLLIADDGGKCIWRVTKQ